MKDYRKQIGNFDELSHLEQWNISVNAGIGEETKFPSKVLENVNKNLRFSSEEELRITESGQQFEAIWSQIDRSMCQGLARLSFNIEVGKSAVEQRFDEFNPDLVGALILQMTRPLTELINRLLQINAGSGDKRGS